MINNPLSSFSGSIATVTLIVIATRSLIGIKGDQLPRDFRGSSRYAVKWQWRVVTFLSGAFWIVISIGSSYQQHHADWVFISIAAVFVALGFWLVEGSVVTNQVGITKKFLWRSRSFYWKDITEIRLRTKQGAVELRSGSRKLTVDSRLVAFQHLLAEIKDHTGLQLIEMS